jgi:lipoate-protein ligase A
MALAWRAARRAVAGAASGAAAAAADTATAHGHATGAVPAPWRVLDLRVPVLQQLHLEEALLRTSKANVLIVNRPTLPAQGPGSIVLGISGNMERLVRVANARADGLELIRRFSGGGTVFIDDSMLLVTAIANNSVGYALQSNPRAIMRWMGGVFERVFPAGAAFCVRENDFCLGSVKCAGNAQAIAGPRWLHHCVFVWEPRGAEFERYLHYPDRVPEYRQGRGHREFVTAMGGLFDSKEDFRDRLLVALPATSLAPLSLDEAGALLANEYYKRTEVLALP